MMNNMKLADKIGVLNVLKDMHQDANDKMSWVRRRSLTRNQPKETVGPVMPKPQFPGYEERLD